MTKKIQIQENNRVNPTELNKRKLAPDLARGFMLLFISIANAPLFLYGKTPHTADQIMIFIDKILVNDRSRPLFIFMFAYGLVQLMNRLQYQNNLEWSNIRRRLERRGFAMILVGILHVVLLAPIDVIAIYGLMCIIFIDFLRFKDKVLWGAVIVSYSFLLYLFVIHGGNQSTELVSSAFIRQSPFLISLKFKVWGNSIISTILTSLPSIFLGILAAKYKILDEPSKHLKFLKWTAFLGLSCSILGGIPLALMNSGLLIHPPNKLFSLVSKLHMPTGIIGALGYVALFGLIAVKLKDKRNGITNAIIALGQRSMTFYIFQSLVFIMVFSPYAGGLGVMGLASSTGVAFITWLVSIVLAEIMRRYHFRGPAEILLRKITYYK